MINTSEYSEFTICSKAKHHLCGSIHVKEKVPTVLFMIDQNDPSKGLYKTCFDCREYGRKINKKRYQKTNELSKIKIGDDLFRHCSNPDHKTQGSIFEQDKVPTELFKKNDNTNTFFKTCKDCREKRSQNHAKNREKRKNEIKFNKKYCISCENFKSTYDFENDIIKTCKACNIKNRKTAEKIANMRNKLKLELIEKNGSSCELCKRIYLKPICENEGVKTMIPFKKNNKYYIFYNDCEYDIHDFIALYKNDLELRILQFDHLPEHEQKERGRLDENNLYEPKIKNVSSFCNWDLMKKESLKCQLICILCHIKETIKREKGITKRHGIMFEKIKYTNDLKKRGCEICHFVDIDLPRFFDFDHVDRDTKIKDLAYMVKCKNYTLEDVKNECKKCRILCKHCHFIQTDIERTCNTKKFLQKRILLI